MVSLIRLEDEAVVAVVVQQVPIRLPGVAERDDHAEVRDDVCPDSFRNAHRQRTLIRQLLDAEWAAEGAVNDEDDPRWPYDTTNDVTLFQDCFDTGLFTEFSAGGFLDCLASFNLPSREIQGAGLPRRMFLFDQDDPIQVGVVQ